MRFTAFSFLLLPTAEQLTALRRHAGAARFAYNVGVGFVQQALEAKNADSSVKVPWSSFDLINAFNRWKLSPAAGVDALGRPGLPWRGEVSAQVFEEAMVDLGHGLRAFSDAKKAATKRRVAFPRRKKKGRTRDSFRLRNKRGSIRVGLSHVHLPTLGELRVKESTRRLRRVLRAKQQGVAAKLLFVTVSETAGRWHLRVQVEAAAFHPQVAKRKQYDEIVGIDRGLKTFAVAALADGQEAWRRSAPKPLSKHLKRLRRASRAHSRKQQGSRNRRRATQRLARLHARLAQIRRNHTHKLSSYVAKTHRHVALEDLHIAGMLGCHSLARSIADSSWGLFASQLRYKGEWYGCVVDLVDRFAPTSKRCCRCGEVVAHLGLNERVFSCAVCGWRADRDTNAAANCAIYGIEQFNVAAKQAETLNACGEGSSGRRRYRGETALSEARRVSAA